MGPAHGLSARLATPSRFRLDMPLTETVTVSRDPAPFGPSMSAVDSVRRSDMYERSPERYDAIVLTLSHGIGVNSAPPIKSSLPDALESGVDEPFSSRPFPVAVKDSSG